MRRSTKVAAPLLAATALAILTGCNQAETTRNQTSTTQTAPTEKPASETTRGGFGSTYAPWLIAGAVGALLFFGAGE
jgi:hypothetical protein